jgi:hypothetical protein
LKRLKGVIFSKVHNIVQIIIFYKFFLGTY